MRACPAFSFVPTGELNVSGHGGIFHASMPRFSHASARKLNVSGHGGIFLVRMPRFSYTSAGKLGCVDFKNLGGFL